MRTLRLTLHPWSSFLPPLACTHTANTFTKNSCIPAHTFGPPPFPPPPHIHTCSSAVAPMAVSWPGVPPVPMSGLPARCCPGERFAPSAVGPPTTTRCFNVRISRRSSLISRMSAVFSWTGLVSVWVGECLGKHRSLVQLVLVLRISAVFSWAGWAGGLGQGAASVFGHRPAGMHIHTQHTHPATAHPHTCTLSHSLSLP